VGNLAHKVVKKENAEMILVAKPETKILFARYVRKN
jgi:hypothetical protein